MRICDRLRTSNSSNMRHKDVIIIGNGMYDFILLSQHIGFRQQLI